MKSLWNGFWNERRFVYHAMCSASGFFCFNREINPCSTTSHKLTPFQPSLVKKINQNLKNSCFFCIPVYFCKVIDQNLWDIGDISTFFQLASKNRRGITLLWILSDISLILDFIVSLDSGICFIVWDDFSQPSFSHHPIQGFKRISPIVYGFLAFSTCKTMTNDECKAALLVFKLNNFNSKKVFVLHTWMSIYKVLF